MKTSTQKQIDQTVRRLMRVAGCPGAAVAVVQGDEVYAGAYGVKSVETGEGVTPKTLFANASTTKAVTCAGIALLVDQKKMAWDDPVRKYLPHFRLADAHADALVAVRDLVCHRTGLPRHDFLWYRNPNTRDDILRRLAGAKLTATFRGTYQYQNICYMAAGECARVASGAASWDAFITESLLRPLGMERANLSANDAQADPDHATPHVKRKGKIVPIGWLNFDNVGPAGTMNTCPEEMALWLRFHLDGGVNAKGDRLISEAALKETYKPHTPTHLGDAERARYPWAVQQTYCMGWSLWNYRGGIPMLNHGGAINGFRSQAVLLPTEKIAVAVYTNLSEPFVECTRNAILDILLGLDTLDWEGALKAEIAKNAQDKKDAEKKRRETKKNGVPPPRPLPSYEGVYRDPAYGEVTVTLDGRTLRLRWNTDEATIKPLTYQTFTLQADPDTDLDDKEIRFRANATGEIVALNLFDVEFPRAIAEPG